MADVEADRGGKGKEGGIGERRAFFSLPRLPTLFYMTATQAMDLRPLLKESKEPEMDGQENIGVVLR